jgi:peptidoglycan/LPS O-acetylase OafA/YrhL
MVCVVTLWSIRYGTPSERLALHGDTLWSLSFLMNWHEVAAAHDYWSAFALQSPLTHLWSLAVEEQFYLVWPLVAIAVARFARRPQRTMFIVCSVGTVASFALMAALYDAHASTRVYEGTDARIGAMLIGGLCATNTVRSFIARLATSAKQRLSTVLGFALALASLGVLWMYAHAHGSDGWLFRGGFLLFSLAIGLVISSITVATEHQTGLVRSRLVAALSLRPLRSIGRLSYGLYLWHWPIFLALSPARTGLSEWPLLALRRPAELATASAMGQRTRDSACCRACRGDGRHGRVASGECDRSQCAGHCRTCGRTARTQRRCEHPHRKRQHA